jgi:hypothetical protein
LFKQPRLIGFALALGCAVGRYVPHEYTFWAFVVCVAVLLGLALLGEQIDNGGGR